MTTLPPKRQTKKKRIWLYVLLGTVLIFVLAAVAGAFFAQSSLLDRAKREHKDELLVATDKATIMIMGIDEREDDVGRSDTLMVATIDPVKNEASLLSIPRDTRVAIPGNGYDKINAAYAYGGEKLTFRTRPDANSPIAFTIEEEICVSYVDMVKGWIKVKCTPKKSRKSFVGWIETEWLCSNPVTTCS